MTANKVRRYQPLPGRPMGNFGYGGISVCRRRNGERAFALVLARARIETRARIAVDRR